MMLRYLMHAGVRERRAAHPGSLKRKTAEGEASERWPEMREKEADGTDVVELGQTSARSDP